MKKYKILSSIIIVSIIALLFTGCKYNPYSKLTDSDAGNVTFSPQQQAPTVSDNQQTTSENKTESNASTQANTENSSQIITENEAKQKAISHAKLNEKDIVFAYTKLGIDDGVQVYEIEFYTQDREYDYDINAVTGAIIEYDYEAEHYSKENTKSDNVIYITETRAKEIALNNAGMKESEVTFVCVNLDHDDGRKQYEIEFYKDNIEYDYNIDALTGEIISFDSDAEKYSPPIDNTKYIGNDEVKKIAIEKAGVKEADIFGLRIELDIDDGKAIYEVEFYSDNIEYNFEINAVTGNIIEFEKDND